MSPASFFFEARDLGLINCTQSWLQENFDISEIHDYLSSACKRKRLRKIIAFLFDKPSPEDIPGITHIRILKLEMISLKCLMMQMISSGVPQELLVVASNI